MQYKVDVYLLVSGVNSIRFFNQKYDVVQGWCKTYATLSGVNCIDFMDS